jgi:hypothetical protein
VQYDNQNDIKSNDGGAEKDCYQNPKCNFGDPIPNGSFAYSSVG